MFLENNAHIQYSYTLPDGGVGILSETSNTIYTTLSNHKRTTTVVQRRNRNNRITRRNSDYFLPYFLISFWFFNFYK